MTRSQKKPPVRDDGTPTPDHDFPVRYGKKDAARMLGISVRTLDYRLEQKKMKFTKAGNRVMIARSEILRYGRTNDTDPVITKPRKPRKPPEPPADEGDKAA
jgi:excisionase family DNA binding protein